MICERFASANYPSAVQFRIMSGSLLSNLYIIELTLESLQIFKFEVNQAIFFQSETSEEISMEVSTAENGNGPLKEDKTLSTTKPEDMTSRDYYFDSYAHFGIHEEVNDTSL